MTTTIIVNLLKDPYDVYIGRASQGRSGYFGNPYRITGDETRESVIDKFRVYFYRRLERDPEFKSSVQLLQGKRLGCFCKPLACHGDVIAEYLNKLLDDELEEQLDVLAM